MKLISVCVALFFVDVVVTQNSTTTSGPAKEFDTITTVQRFNVTTAPGRELETTTDEDSITTKRTRVLVFQNPPNMTWYLGVHTLQLSTNIPDTSFQQTGSIHGLLLDKTSGSISINVTKELRREHFPLSVEFSAATTLNRIAQYKPDIFLCLCEKKDQCTDKPVKVNGSIEGNVYRVGCHCPTKTKGIYCQQPVQDVCDKCPFKHICNTTLPQPCGCPDGYAMSTRRYTYRCYALFTCPPGWFLHRQSCFKLFHERKTWNDSRYSCLDEGADLVSIPDEETNQVLIAKFFSKDEKANTWIGFNDIAEEGHFTWANGFDTSNFTFWESSQPNDWQNEDCGSLWTEHWPQWADSSCNDKFIYFCGKTAASAVSCPPGWFLHGESCFKVYHEEKTWEDSRDYCISEGGQLASIPDESTNRALKKALFSQDSVDIWIGLNDRAEEGQFVWADNPENVTYNNWYPDQPNNYENEDCVNIWSFYPRHEWADAKCSLEYNFLCERPSITVYSKALAFKNPDHLIWYLGLNVLQLETSFQDAIFERYGDLPGLEMDSNGLVTINVTRYLEDLRDRKYPSYLEFVAVSSFGGQQSEYQPDILICLCEKKEQCKTPRNGSVHGNKEGNVHAMECDCQGAANGRYCENEIDVCANCPCKKSFPVHFKCQNGYKERIVRNSVECFDIDECQDNNGGCEQGCVNTVGSWKCFCNSGFTLIGSKCIALACPAGWIMFENNCYKLYRDKKTWNKSRVFCLNQDAYLAIVPDEKTNQFLLKEFYSKIKEDIWIGLNDIKQEGKFVWLDSHVKFQYNNWGDGQPNNWKEQDCVNMWYEDSGKWSDYGCDEVSINFICQKAAVSVLTCPKGWYLHDQTCYKLYKHQYTWQDSKQFCVTEGGRLASVPDKQTNKFLLTKTRPPHCKSKIAGVHAGFCVVDKSVAFYSKDKFNIWIGLNDIAVESQFVWTDSLEKKTFTYWGSGQPNDYKSQDCVHMWTEEAGKWSDLDCLNKFHFVCQREAFSVLPCPSGWLPYHQSCFKLYKKGKRWSQARDVCLSQKGHLASIRDENVNQFVINKFVSQDKNNIWIGLDDLDVEGVFVWSDIPLAKKYTFWGEDQPNNNKHEQDCTHIWALDLPKWADSECAFKYHFICESNVVRIYGTGAVFQNPHDISWHLGHYSLQLTTDIQTIKFEKHGDLPGLTIDPRGLVSINVTKNLEDLRDVKYPSVLEFVATALSGPPSVYRPNLVLCLCQKKEQCLSPTKWNLTGNVHVMDCDCKGTAEGTYCEKVNGVCDKCQCEKYPSLSFKCPTGFQAQIVDGEIECHDIDECLHGKGGCQQICVNTLGSRKCLCHAGYTQIGTQCKACDYVYHTDHGEIKSPNYPRSYPNNFECRWEIQVSKGDTVRLSFQAPFVLPSSLSSNNSLDTDYVEVFDVSNKGTLISKGRWSGTDLPMPLKSTNSKMVLVFHSGHTVNGAGFHAAWDSVKSCGGSLREGAGSLMSPNYPSQYPFNLECRWEIVPPAGSNVTLHFSSLFDVENGPDCAWDYVEVFQGKRSIGQWCGSHHPPVITSSGDKLVVVFKSDSSQGGKGFFASWETS